jgi:hypothetical protein
MAGHRKKNSYICKTIKWLLSSNKFHTEAEACLTITNEANCMRKQVIQQFMGTVAYLKTIVNTVLY